MQVTQSAAANAHTGTLALKLMATGSRCIGCADCTGLCRELVEAMMLPDMLLAHRDK